MSMPLSPLREDDVIRPNRRPTTGPEIDDPEPADSGIDDGLLPGGRGDFPREFPEEFPRTPGITPGRRPSFPGEFPYGPPPINPDSPPTIGPRRVDVNVYQHKKTLAQGMMDLALLSANANQLRYVLESDGKHPYYYPGIVLISISIVLQITVGVGLILNSRYNVKKERDIWKADRINNFTILGVFLITITNVFVSAFGVAVNSTTVALVAQEDKSVEIIK